MLRSLKAKNFSEARALQPRAMEAIYRHFETETQALRAQRAAALSDSTDQDIQSLAFEIKRGQ